LKSCYVLHFHYDDERNKTVFHNTTPDLQDQDPDRFIWSQTGLDLTPSLRPHHCCMSFRSWNWRSKTNAYIRRWVLWCREVSSRHRTISSHSTPLWSTINRQHSGEFAAELRPRFCSQLDWGQGRSMATNL